MIEDFIIESNAIEGIHDRSRITEEVEKLRDFLNKRLSVKSVTDFTIFCQPTFKSRTRTGHIKEEPNVLRTEPGFNVYVGDHRPPPGSPQIEAELEYLLSRISRNTINPYHGHVEYETLHPFMDGNGRSGRAVWLWHVVKYYNYQYRINFLHCWYYMSLQNSQERNHK